MRPNLPHRLIILSQPILPEVLRYSPKSGETCALAGAYSVTHCPQYPKEQKTEKCPSFLAIISTLWTRPLTCGATVPLRMASLES